uniref:Pectin acetylesterase n=1 Tax=Aegilops tauschii subsp. strangulata TaxID=200361 RepID=A0A453GWL2_AEGTS
KNSNAKHIIYVIYFFCEESVVSDSPCCYLDYHNFVEQSIAEAAGDWYHGRSQGEKEIDCEYPCNPTCSGQLPP